MLVRVCWRGGGGGGGGGGGADLRVGMSNLFDLALQLWGFPAAVTAATAVIFVFARVGGGGLFLVSVASSTAPHV